MDKNQFIGLILMFALLAYFTWFTPEPVSVTKEAETESGNVTSSATDTTNAHQTIATPQQSGDSLNAEKHQKYGAFAFALDTEEQTTLVENDELKITFSSLGGKVKEVMLKKHKDYLGNPFRLVDGNKSLSSLIVNHQGKKINLSELGYTSKISKRADTTEVTYSLTDGHFTIHQQYLIPPKGFEVIYKINTSKLNTVLDPSDISFQWIHAVNRAEGTLDNSRNNANVRYYLSNDEYDELDETSIEFEEANLATRVKWVAFKQKFFTAAVVANQAFIAGYINQQVNFADTSSVKNMVMNLIIPYSDFISGFSAKYYFGTNSYNILKEVAPEFEENLDIGWGPLPLVNKYIIIPIFHFLQRFMSNYGLIIIILVLIIRLLLAPLTYKSHLSMAKMRVMKSELDEIKKKHQGNMQKTQQEQMNLYRQVGINPLSGCIPMLLQMPILFSLFFFFPNAVELRGKSFLWAHDLSTYDSIFSWSAQIPLISSFYGNHVSLFTLLMTASTILYTWSNSQITTVQGPMKTLQYIMPIMFLFVLNGYASGLTFYYFVSNIATFGQTLLFKKFINEDKIHQILQDNKKKNSNKKKSKFQLRLEEAMKTNNESKRKKKKK